MSQITEIFSVLQVELATFLAAQLPRVGGDAWWQRYVIAQLAPAQARSCEDLEAGDVHGLAVDAVLRISERNWAELEHSRSTLRGTQILLAELYDTWRRNGQDEAYGIEISDLLRTVDTGIRVLRSVGASGHALDVLDTIKRDLRRREDDGGDGVEHGDQQGRGERPLPDPIVKREDNSWITGTHENNITKKLQNNTFIGIDFGTSTSVVSLIQLDETSKRMKSMTLNIDQPGEYGEIISHHLVNTVLAWKRNILLFGSDAYRLRQELTEGRSVFSSFKMRLGIDIGPTYPNTMLRNNEQVISIESANDATREFFKCLAGSIKKAVVREGLSVDLRFAVTVPASFEANQRRDLLRNMVDAGLPVSESCLIDEPNAAFLSFLHERSFAINDEFYHSLLAHKQIVLVYDFGAGTCDVSILEIQIIDGSMRSRNLAISKFTALGGDDIDRAIAKKLLIPQLLSTQVGYEPSARIVDEALVPRLQSSAERLKLAAVKWMADQGIEVIEQLRATNLAPFRDQAVPRFTIQGRQLELLDPHMSLSEFADVLMPFVDRYDPGTSTKHVYAPVADAIAKSGLVPEDINAVLFIGGSAANPVVRSSVMRHLPSSVRAIVPLDLQRHVSIGAALHSFGFHAMGQDFIVPITSECINIVTRGGRLERVIPASTEVPSPQGFHTTLRVQSPGQRVVELPICGPSARRLLGILRLESPGSRGFSRGDLVEVSARITKDKLLEVDAKVGGVSVGARLLNPLTNEDIGEVETRMLQARQRFNEALLKFRGTPPISEVEAYAQAAMEAESFEIAADMFVTAERIDNTRDHATSIVCAYARNKKTDQAKKWAQVAMERSRTAVTVYNYAIMSPIEEQEGMLREAVSLDPDFAVALMVLGRLLHRRGDPEGSRLISKCIQIGRRKMVRHSLDRDGCRVLMQAAQVMDDRETLDLAHTRLRHLDASSPYDEGNLAGSGSDGLLTIST